jgi:hypothetical protein
LFCPRSPVRLSNEVLLKALAEIYTLLHVTFDTTNYDWSIKKIGKCLIKTSRLSRYNGIQRYKYNIILFAM